MKSSDAHIKIEDELNKLSSGDYINIESTQIQGAVNKAALLWVRRNLRGIQGEGAEGSITRVDDLQVLLRSGKLAGTDKGIFFLSSRLPTGFMRVSRITPICNKNTCISKRITSYLIEDSNVDVYLSSFDLSPSFDFEQSFHTFGANRIRVYHNNDFEVKEIDISYYTKPQFIEFEGAVLPSGGEGKDMTWEFKDDVCEEIISDAVKILADSIESINRSQLSEREVDKNN